MGKYGADGVRVGMLLTSPAGNDLPFDEALCEQGRNFSNKFWNALRLVKGWEVDQDATPTEAAMLAVSWMEARFNEALESIEDHYSKYRISDALMAIYKLIWDDFCSWYLEMVKPAFGAAIDPSTLERTVSLFERLMQVLHPFMPFITEEIWHLLRTRDEDIIISPMPEAGSYDAGLLKSFETARSIIMQVRSIRQEKGLPMKESVQLHCNLESDHRFDPVVKKLANIKSMHYGQAVTGPAYSFLVGSVEYFIPAGDDIDLDAEREKLQKELDYQRGFLSTIMKKLGNERFVANAPEAVVELEKQKKADAEEKIAVLEEKLERLG
jgi:valyl-tRNA synthetase